MPVAVFFKLISHEQLLFGATNGVFHETCVISMYFYIIIVIFFFRSNFTGNFCLVLIDFIKCRL